MSARNPTAGEQTEGATLLSPGQLLGELRNRHGVWYSWTLIYCALSVLCLGLALVDERLFQGVSLWNKPFKFSLSIAIYFATLGWFAALLPSGYFQTFRGKLMTFLPVACALFEVGYITLQAARGEASHFNTSSSFYGAMYSLMGVGAVLLVLICLWMGTSILRSRGTADVWVLSVGIGLIGTFVFGGGFGGYLGNASAHWVGGAATDAGGLPVVHWSRTGGDLRVAHFFGIHAMQIIPAIGAALVWSTRHSTLGNGPARLILICASIVFGAFCSATFVQAVQGNPFL